MSDVPIGVFLSGGIDSSAVAAMMAELIPGRVNSFSIAFNDPSFDESTHAREVARWLGTNHRELTLEPSLLPDVLPTVMDRLDEPLADASILPTYLLSRFARQHVKVALGGDGGDELFAGYPTLLAHRLAGLYQRVPGGLRQHLIAPSIEKLPVSLDNFSLDFKAKRFVRDACLPVSDRHLRWMGAFTAEERLRLLTRDVREELNASGGTAETVVLQQVATQRLRHPINQVLYLDMKLYLEGDILVKLDRASMMASLEARVPLLNGDLVEHVARLPHRLKLSGLKTKYLLKRSLRGVLPDHILARPKKGFGIPVAKWIRGPLREPLLDVLSSERVEQDRLFDYSTVHTLLDEHFSSRRDNRKQLWTLFVFQQWWALIQNCYPREEPRPSLVGRPRFAGALSEETHADG